MREVKTGDKKLKFRVGPIFMTALFFAVGLADPTAGLFAGENKSAATTNIPVDSTRQALVTHENTAGPRYVFDAFIVFFQQWISVQDGPNCAFRPTCSAYGRRAIREHGPLRGVVLTADRLTRCNPGATGGYDPVPDNP